MKMEAMTTFMKDQKDIQKVYLLNQNYSHGQQVAKYAKEDLKRKRPDIEIVGEDLHPIAQVRDFAPYIAKIKASGADTVVTGNWGSDLSLLVKAAVEGRLQRQVLHLLRRCHRHADGARHQRRRQGLPDRLLATPTWVADRQRSLNAFKAKYNDDFYTGSIVRMLEALTLAMAQTKSTDPVKVAFAMEGLKWKSAFGGEVEMRKSDHQLQQPLYISVWQKADAK